MHPTASHVLRLAFVVALSSAVAWAQGSDNCATAQAISGPGPHPFNNASATTGPQGQTEVLCNSFGSMAMQRDVWFTWVAPSTDSFDFSLCGLTSVDSKIAVYPGAGCPTSGTAIGCNDDSCGLVSHVIFSATAGSSYTLQIGVFPGAAGGTGTFTMGVTVPPPPCGSNTGPDVIVGEVTDVLNVAASGGIDAIALGTDACNIGTAPLNWVASTPAHPVIRQNAYRYKVINGAGRFEQIGASWLKHAFAAVNGSTCCTCQGGGGLGVGCSDPYGSGLNGNQGSAGPNWQVNAHTGVFAYPPANPAWSGAIARRCQMRTSELENTSLPGAARYFGECHYVTADDAQTNLNGNNNASWREMLNSGGSDANFSLTGSTHRAQPAIYAWGVAETGVRLSEVQVPGDGLVVVGSKATNLGGGIWHYQYAVYNMNADRNVGSFSVSIPAGATVTNIGFHDIDYHDGDGNGNATISGTDWVGTNSGGTLTWACETQAVNNNANAIRWGTLYNFHFDADTGPVTGALSFGLWKTGAPASMSATGEVPGTNAFSSFCFGDGSGLACPCGNSGAAGNGCANSAFPAGANLSANGNASASFDAVQLAANNVTGNVGVFFQGTAQGSPTVIDDGIGCVGGVILRIGTSLTGGAASVYPEVGDPSISVRGAITPAGGTFYYQCFYRNSVGAFCPPAASNRTNAVAISWIP